jgi:hypothetical protein
LGDCSNEKIPRDSAVGGRVRDVMVTRPKTLPTAATVSDLRRLFENPHAATYTGAELATTRPAPDDSS